MRTRVFAATPVRNEARHLGVMADSVTAQTRRPDRWVIGDDGSSDGTGELAAALTRALDWADVLDPEPAHSTAIPDRLATGAAVRALNRILTAADDDEPYTHVVKLDGDIELPPNYIERLLAAFEARPALGICGGIMLERFGSSWRPVRQPSTHAPPPARMWSVACLDAIGGLHELLGWDTIDEVYARMRGFETVGYPSLPVRHLRAAGSAQGAIRGRARHGACAYIAHQPPGWVVLRGAKVAVTLRPFGLGGGAFVWGYANAHRRDLPRVPDEAFRSYVRSELRRRVFPR